MPELTAEQIEIGVDAFLQAMRREHIKRFGIEAEVRVPNLVDLAPADRMILSRSIKAAIAAAQKTEFGP